MGQNSEKSSDRATPTLAARSLDQISKSFFENDELRGLIDRACDYARAGVCLHFTGTAGVGKTSLAVRVAKELGRPISFMAGNEWLTAQDFIGREVGSTTSTVVDRYVQSVRRTEKTTRNDWQDSILAMAMKNGHTLIYDEFTRATPEANATLLTVLEEGMLVFSDRSSPRAYLDAHPDFRMILTSNPHDYLGVNGAPDALMDRVLTMPMQNPSVATLAGITAHRTGLSASWSQKIVEMVENLWKTAGTAQVSVLRTAMMIARIATIRQAAGTLTDSSLATIATDVLVGRGVTTSAQDVAAALQETRKAA